MELNIKLELDLDDILELDEDVSDEAGHDVYVFKDSKDLQKEIKERLIDEVVDDNFKSSWYPTSAMKDFKTCWKEFLEKHRQEIIDAVAKRISSSILRKGIDKIIENESK